jgi:acyl-CoA reductase-like NAD-dependent aldehyde dehydrogenase
LIDRTALDRVEKWVGEAVSEGARCLTGGKREGPIFQPTVMTATRPEMKVNCEEVFAPIVTVEPFDDFGQALQAMNRSDYGLQMGIFTRDIRKIFKAYEECEVGGLLVNDVPTFRVDSMPYGGVKDSGLGREGVKYAIEEMTEPKLLSFNFPSSRP